MKKQSQKEKILEYMRIRPISGITPLEALYKFGCMRLASRIYDLKQDGHIIKKTMLTTRNSTFAYYTLRKEAKP